MTTSLSPVRAIRPLLSITSSHARALRGLATSSRLQRPPQPTPPAREEAEPAIVKSPSQSPNVANWPGRPKGQANNPAQISWQSGTASKRSVPYAESSKAAQDREAWQRAQTQSGAQTQTQASPQPQEQPARSTLSARATSTVGSEGSCSTLSPSSPAGPRSQTPVALDKGKDKETPKAVAPEEENEKSAGTALPSSNSAAAAKPADSPKSFRARKAALSLTSTAVERLQELLNSDSGPRLIRIGVRNKGCAGMSYHLEYVTPDQAGKFDERVKQDGVEVLIDSKALFSIIGSEMDWQEDRLSAKFVFNNPNVKESCGCGESFLT